MKIRWQSAPGDDESRSSRQARAAERRALKELAAVYRAVDALLAPFTCDRSAACCQLQRPRREPFLFSIELVRLRDGLERAGRPFPAERADGGCRLLDKSGMRCSVYGDRPFGCRTFFCEKGRGPRSMPNLEINRLSARLTRLSDGLALSVSPRQLSELLAEAANGEGEHR
ncbi:MAG TPA: zinc/iron-chelating domain-containing protein [Myxococcales bacterium]|nr:zinc/iron-chelating domain-containing protein [Myxococcales bacterium]